MVVIVVVVAAAVVVVVVAEVLLRLISGRRPIPARPTPTRPTAGREEDVLRVRGKRLATESVGQLESVGQFVGGGRTPC